MGKNVQKAEMFPKGFTSQKYFTAFNDYPENLCSASAQLTRNQDSIGIPVSVQKLPGHQGVSLYVQKHFSVDNTDNLDSSLCPAGTQKVHAPRLS